MTTSDVELWRDQQAVELVQAFAAVLSCVCVLVVFVRFLIA